VTEEIRAGVGEEFEVSLQATPTAGFTWEVSIPTEGADVINFLGSEWQAPVPSELGISRSRVQRGSFAAAFPSIAIRCRGRAGGSRRAARRAERLYGIAAVESPGTRGRLRGGAASAPLAFRQRPLGGRRQAHLSVGRFRRRLSLTPTASALYLERRPILARDESIAGNDRILLRQAKDHG